MLNFESDYVNGAHEEILKKFIETNDETSSTYGADKWSTLAKEKILKVIGKRFAKVDFLVGGTQTNETVISTVLKDYEGVIAADTGHINVHEAGAIEWTGSKVLTIKNSNGKINPDDLRQYLEKFYSDPNFEYMVFPGMVYISYPTEYGTLYTKKELKEIYSICNKYKMTFFIDGARLGYGLMSKEADIDIKNLARLCDVFYIGGTKVGALCGEAVVWTKNNQPKNFITSMKKRGTVLAKSRTIGIQFDTLFTNNLYFEISKHAIDMAEKMKKIFEEKGYKFYIDSPTNQQFFIMDTKKANELKKKVKFSVFENYDKDHVIARFVTSWATKEEDVDKLAKIL